MQMRFSVDICVEVSVLFLFRFYKLVKNASVHYLVIDMTHFSHLFVITNINAKFDQKQDSSFSWMTSINCERLQLESIECLF